MKPLKIKTAMKYPPRYFRFALIAGAVIFSFVAFHFIKDAYHKLKMNIRILRKKDLNYQLSDISLIQSFEGEKIVHFDLKGAPPKIEYLVKLFPLIKRQGATGLLIEYEDMFPYDAELADISAKNAYSLSNITFILEEAERNDLMVIPLVQIFGHMEFVLKSQKYLFHREVREFPDVICPNHIDTPFLVRKMIDQVLAAHPRSRYFHMGCDEVYTIGSCDRCHHILRANKWRKKDIYFDHIRRTAEYVIRKHPTVRPIIWGDEIVSANEKFIVHHRISDVVDVMLWNYYPDLSSMPSDEDMTTYSKLFKSIWIASAYKGANNADQIYPNPKYHLKNNHAWMSLVKAWKNKIQFKGIVLTGWQRFNHFSVLCELLPVGLPTMTMILEYLKGSDEGKYDNVNSVLGCNKNLPLHSSELKNEHYISSLRCGFPGSRAYITILQYSRLLKDIEYDLGFMSGVHLRFYNLVQNFTNPREVKGRINSLKRLLLEIKNHELAIRDALQDIYDEDTINEWIFTHVLPYEMRLESATKITDSLATMKTWPRRPLKHTETHWRRFFHNVCGPEDKTGCYIFHMHTRL